MKKRLAALALMVLVMASVLNFPAYADSTGLDFRLDSNTTCVKVGETTQIRAYSGSLDAIDVTWTSDNESIAKVDSNGTVTGMNWGQATVTATSSWGATATCVVNVAFKGIDVSSWQTSVDWSAVKNWGADFAMIRTGYGGENWSNQTDKCFETYYNGAVANGLKVGVYHYSYATNTTMAAQEADFCLHILNGRHLDYPVIYDVENTKAPYNQAALSSDTLGAIVQTFCEKIKQAGYKVGVYSYVNFYNAHLNSPLVSQYDTWIANTGGVTKPNFSHPYTMWQYAETSVPGVQGADNNLCDVNYSYYDYAGSGAVAGPAPPTDPNVFQCDTTGTYTFGSNSVYYYKITTADTIVPSVTSSNPSAVTVAYSRKLSDGFLFRINRVGQGQATITTTAGDGRQVSFTAVSSDAVVTPPTITEPGDSTPAESLVCDTTQPYTFGSNPVYYYKITTTVTTAPKAVSSNPSAVPVSFSKKLSDGYLYQIRNAGKGSAVITTTTVSGRASVSFTAYGTGASQTVVSDTPATMTMVKGKTYQFKFTPYGGITSLYFTTGNGSVIKSVLAQKVGGCWYFKIQAVGKGRAGVYTTIPGKAPVRQCIVTVA